MSQYAPFDPSRRRALKAVAAAGAAALVGPGARAAAGEMHSRPIPKSGERIPVVGMGSYVTFNVGADPGLLAQRTEVLRAFFAAGGGMIDSSPMYGTAEAAIGHCLGELGHPGGLFSATKVWTFFQGDGEEQMADSRRLWQVPRFDLMQVHNLLGTDSHLETMRAEREEGLVRYLGVTTSHGRRHGELARVMEHEPLDFVQLTYNILDREAEGRLLPLAADRGIAVIVNRPFRRKALIHRFEGHPLPPWAGDIGARTWAQFLLQFIVSHPAVTCAIPATSRVDHMEENMAVLRGPLPDAATRRRMVAYVESL
jgi:diketogulonate reductase-like aldo/keto reductase